MNGSSFLEFFAALQRRQEAAAARDSERHPSMPVAMVSTVVQPLARLVHAAGALASAAGHAAGHLVGAH